MRNLKLKQGENKKFRLIFTNENGKPLSIEGWAVCFNVKDEKDGDMLERVFTKEHEDSQEGKTVIDLSNLSMVLRTKEYYFEIKVKTASGNIYPVKSGTLTVFKSEE